jgi:Pyruvate/2-oxoacid:ferredoxin oxidoreductase delta subunit
MEGKTKKALKDQSIEENQKEYGVEDNASQLTFADGKVKSEGHLRKVTITIDLRYCKGCGICSEMCPTEALRMMKEEGKLKGVIQKIVAENIPAGIEVGKEANLTWQALPHPAGLIVNTGVESDNLTGAWRVGEIVIPDSNYCVDCGVCNQVCPEGIIEVEMDQGQEE